MGEISGRNLGATDRVVTRRRRALRSVVAMCSCAPLVVLGCQGADGGDAPRVGDGGGLDGRTTVASRDARADRTDAARADARDTGTPVDAGHRDARAPDAAPGDALADSGHRAPPDAGDGGTDALADAARRDASPDDASSPEADAPVAPALYTVSGTLTGLVGTVTLQDNGADDLTLTADGPFTFTASVASGGPFAVTVETLPLPPVNEQCVVTHGAGTVGSANVTGVVVVCAATPPAAFAPGQVDVEADILTAEGRTAISPLIYGVNANAQTGLPAALMSSVTLVRRGGDRGNTYNWETNVSNGGIENGYGSDLTLAAGVADPSAPGGQDLTALTANRAAGRATMVPFVLNDYVAGPVASNIPWDVAGWDIAAYFNREVLVKPTPFASTPDLTDGLVYTDEQLAYLRAQFPDDILAPGPGQLLVGVDNEADLWEYNFPMLQRGSGDALYASNGVQIGNRVTGPEFTQRVIDFATRVKELAPNAQIVGPAHFGYDGWMCWHQLTSPWTDLGRWFMDDFLEAVSAASTTAGVRLLDTWDFHWYPQATFNGTTVSALDNAVSPLTPDEVDAIVQGPRSYWDTTYDEGSWITSSYHLDGPAYMLTRLQSHLAAGYPGTGLGVSEYFPGGRNHIASGLATVDSLGVFQSFGIALAALWPLGDSAGLTYAFGGIELVHNADGNGLRYADTRVSVTNPDTVDLSIYGGMDTPDRVTVLVVNKTTGPLNVGLRITNVDALARVSVYRIDAADPSPYLALSDTLTLSNAYPYAAPALSAAMLVFQTP